MKLALLLLSIPLFAQYGVARKVISGTGAPLAGYCMVANDVGNVYARNNAAAVNSTFYVCSNTAALTYEWELLGAGGGEGTVNNGGAGSLAYYLTTGNTISALSTGTGILDFITTPSSANLRAAVTDESGTGALLFANGNMGTPSAIVLTNATGLPAASIVGQFAANAQTSTYQVLAADFTACKTILVASGTFTITLVASGAQPASGQCVTIMNYGTGIVTLARSGQNINGAAANLTGTAAVPGSPTGWRVYSDGTNYAAEVIGPSVAGLSDLRSSRTSSSVLNIAAGNAQVGTLTTAFSAATATLSGSSASGTAYVYISSASVLSVGHNSIATITCSGCTTVAAITGFPDGSIPLASATFTTTTWDAAGVTLSRGAFSSRPIVAGTNVTVSETSGVVTISSTGAPSCASGTIIPLGAPNLNSGVIADVSAASALASRAYGFTLPCSGTPVKLALQVGVVSGTCGGTCGFAVAFYDSAGAILGSTTNLTSGGSPDINTLGLKAITLTTPGAMVAGLKYYLDMATTSTALKIKGAEAFESCAAQNSIASWCSSAANAFTGTFGSMVGPATLGALSDLSAASADGRQPLLYLSF